MKKKTIKRMMALIIAVILTGAFALSFTACGGDDGNGGNGGQDNPSGGGQDNPSGGGQDNPSGGGQGNPSGGDDGNNDPCANGHTFVDGQCECGVIIAVTDIKLPEDINLPLGSTVTLTGIVEPEDAKNQTITWAIKNAYGASITLSGNTLTIGETSIGSEWGRIKLTADISDGLEAGISFTKDFELELSRYNTQTNKLYFTYHGGTWQDDKGNSGTWQYLDSGSICYVKDVLGEAVKKGAEYKITVNGNLNTNLNNFDVVMDGPDGIYGADVRDSTILGGSMNKEFIFRTYNDDKFPSHAADDAILKFIAATTDPVTEENQGKVKAIINNFNLAIEEN